MKTKSTYMRVSRELLNELRSKKLVMRESYADVIKRLLKDKLEEEENSFPKSFWN